MKSLSKSTAYLAKPEVGFAYLGVRMQGGFVGVDQKVRTFGPFESREVAREVKAQLADSNVILSAPVKVDIDTWIFVGA